MTFKKRFTSFGWMFFIVLWPFPGVRGAAPTSSATPANIQISGTSGNGFQVVSAGSPTSDLRVSVRDANDQDTLLPSGKTVYLTATDAAGISFIPEISINGGAFQPFTGSLVIGTGQGNTPPFRFRRATPGRITLQAWVVDFPSPSLTRQAWYTVEVLSSGATFTNVRARTTSQPTPITGATVLFTPDRDGVDDGAILSCIPPSPTTSWELLISSDATFPASGIVRRFFGFGTSETYWYGEGFEERTVAKGTYYARYQTMGQGIVSSPVTLVVEAAGFYGEVKKASGEFIEGVEVSVYGSGGGGFARTSGDGRYFVSGLKPQTSYQMELRKNGFITQSFTENTGSSTGAFVNAGTKILSSGVGLEVRATVTSAPTRDVYGNIRVYNVDHSENYWGPIRVASGSFNSDNGRHVNDPLWGTISTITVRPNVEYTVEITLPDFGRSTESVTSPPDGFQSVPFGPLTRKANIYGRVQFPSGVESPFNGEWVSVDALLPGATMPTVSGGVYVPNGNSSGIYELPGVPPGTYTLRAFVRGYVMSTTGPITVTSLDRGDRASGGIDFPPFTSGGQISGSITVVGDSSALSSGNITGPGCNTGFFPLNISAFSRVTFNNAFAQVCLATSTLSTSGSFQVRGLLDGVYEIHSYLPGFQLGSSGPQTVTVSDGVGSKHLTFQALTGQVKIQAILPAGDSGQQVTYELIKENPNPVTRVGVLAGSSPAEATESRLGTGLYRVILKNNNPGRGLVQESVLTVTNGSLSTVTVDMSLPAYPVSGNVEVVGNIVLPSTWNVTVSSVPGLVAAGIIPVVDVYALPLPTYYQNEFTPIRSIPVTVFPSSASYLVPALSPGAYHLRLREDFNSSTTSSGGTPPLNLPELASDSQVIFVSTGAITGVNLTLTNGVKVSGEISRPDTSSDTVPFSVRLRRSNNLSYWGLSIETIGNSGNTYSFQHVAPGDYVLETTEGGSIPRYAAAPVSLKVGTTDKTVNVTLSNGGVVVGRLRDADTQTLLTAQNVSQFLPDNFEISAEANPSIPGGYVQAHRNPTGGGYLFDANTNQFRISRMIPDNTYDLRLRGFSSLGSEAISRGLKTYAPTLMAGLKVVAGQTIDVGVIDLKQGGFLSGTIRNAGGTPLPNIRVVARPSANNGRDQWSLQVETFTQENGRFELQGVSREKRYYDIIAAPRFQSGDPYSRLAGPRYAEERRRGIDVNAPDKLSGNDFTLTLANGVLTGRVVALDNGTLTPALSSKNNEGGERGADIVLHRTGAPFEDSPLGEIEERTAADGTFRVEGLKPGAYTLRVLAMGYASVVKPIVVTAGNTAIGTLSLSRGATVTGPLTKPDGSFPTLNDVRMVLGVDNNFDEFVFGTLESNQDTKQVTGYSISGFQTEKSYSLIIVTGKDAILEAQTGVAFADPAEQRVIPLLYRAAPPRVFVNQSQSLSQTESGPTRVTSLRFFSSQPFRLITDADNNPATLLTVDTGAGTLSDLEINSSRDSLTAVYTVPLSANETSMKLRLSFYTTEKNSDSLLGENFQFNQLFTFYAGIKARRSTTISNVTGGECSLEGVPAGVSFRAGAFDVATSSAIEIGIQSAESLILAPSAAPGLGRAAAMAHTAQPLGMKAYPTAGLFQALSAAPAVDAFSPFYEIFLPAGLSHLLKKDARLTLNYDADAEDPALLNVYFFDPIHEIFLLENAQKTIDEVNRTITVSVGHLSTFVVLPSQASIIGANSFTGREIRVHNAPNPFNLKPKSITLNAAEAADQNQTIDGTMIRYSLPPGKSGEVKIEIYDVAGGLVRVLTQSAPTDGTYYYLEWNGRNDAGRLVSSGLYLARFTLNGSDEKMFKMAVIK
ncbi:MAG: carboxypeptidase regulatory-like domain-containing protein [Elusimicrobia bacterium]|nr:carboxypeptidase regulatory-like domain-containing protein [Elusimicrobiota bacterium]